MIYEKLYLDKIKNVYIGEKQAMKLSQLQRNNVRFIYRQFIKTKPGVIFRDMENSEIFLLVLFLDAVKAILDFPSLILTNNVDEWKDLYSVWSCDANDIIMNSSKLVTDKSVVINSIDEALSACRRDWAVAVVQSDGYSSTFVKMLRSIKTRYKIIIVSGKCENTKEMTHLYNMLYPSNTLSELLENKSYTTLKEKVEYDILFDSIFEEVLVQANSNSGLHNTIELRQEDPSKVKRKNKDSTGTKIKRSKPKTNVSNPNTNLEDHLETNIPVTEKPRISKVTKSNRNTRRIESDEESNPFDSSHFLKDNEITDTLFIDTNLSLTKDTICNENKDFTKDNEFTEISCENNIDLNNHEDEVNMFNVSPDEQLETAADLTMELKCLSEKVIKTQDVTDSPDIFNTETENSNLSSQTHDEIKICEENVINKNIEEISKNDLSPDLFTDENTLQSENDNCKSQLDYKIREIERETTKKFKGSILDSLF